MSKLFHKVTHLERKFLALWFTSKNKKKPLMPDKVEEIQKKYGWDTDYLEGVAEDCYEYWSTP